jgi:hypothetical protein
MPSAEHRYGSTVISAQVIDSGTQQTSVLALTAYASPSQRPYIAVRVGRVLTYVNDYDALQSHWLAWQRARELAPNVFGPEPDAFAFAEEAGRRAFECGHDFQPTERS